MPSEVNVGLPKLTITANTNHRSHEQLVFIDRHDIYNMLSFHCVIRAYDIHSTHRELEVM